MGGKSGAGLSRKGISDSVKGLWRTCDVLLGEKKNNITFVLRCREWEDGGGLMAVCMIIR